MTPQEKWNRLTNPTCIDDYGMAMSLDEVREVKDPVAEDMVRVCDAVAEPADPIYAQLGSAVAAAMDRTVRRCLRQGASGGK